MTCFSLPRFVFCLFVAFNLVLFYFCSTAFLRLDSKEAGRPMLIAPTFKPDRPLKSMLVMTLGIRRSTNFAYQLRALDDYTNPFCSHKCQYTIDRTALSRVDGVFVQPSEITEDGPKRQSAAQIFFIFLHEAPGHSQSKNFKWLSLHAINFTVGFVPGCDIEAGYGDFPPKRASYFGRQSEERRLPDPDAEWELVKSVVLAKTEPAFAVVSHCPTRSHRELYFDEFQRRHPELLHLFGKCYGGRCETAECLLGNTKSYHFYFAFENAVCSRYVTEKFIERIRGLVVPVVLRRSDYQHLLPNDSYIAVDDFERMQDLASFLTMLIANKPAYLRYFEWTRHYERVGPRHINSALCEACVKLYETEKHSTYRNMTEWYSTQKFCDLDFVPSILSKHIE